MNKELVMLAKKAADSWRGTDGYHQAATIIDMLVEEIEMHSTDELSCRGCIWNSRRRKDTPCLDCSRRASTDYYQSE